MKIKSSSKSTPPGTTATAEIHCSADILAKKKIFLVVTGGISAYKAITLARDFVKAGAIVRVSLTEAGSRFITPLTFEALTGQSVVSSMWSRSQKEIEHISYATWADLIVVAPATADFIAKMGAGIADEFALSTILASTAPVLVAPAMNENMYLNRATQMNIRMLKERGAEVMSPTSGLLACGESGLGRLPEAPQILNWAKRIFTPQLFRGKKVVVTGGGTQESWDTIRYLGNRSSGRMGISLAEVLWYMGAEVILILGPGALSPGIEASNFTTIKIRTTLDLLEEIQKNLENTHYLFMAAAPVDFKPKEQKDYKVKKDGNSAITLELVANPDILKTLKGKKPKVIPLVRVGFAAESADLLENAILKLEDKGLDYIVGNMVTPIDNAFGAESTKIKLLKKGDKKWRAEFKGSKFGVSYQLLIALAKLGKKR
ncbi:MAG: bifunctional phosphopantothenoylcysteine decarboxylase/phosphopantothenate--cysteine ligase CoaBC [Deltaproteobacteria bacterium]|jgi:phosphopantothenoylcysteine decarboxylase/phosphopantothenate--cysteine ligase|nr:bifunctional phosphopantothenoylcysteine decarboxylase/phosphopantothenate--cysteine ligase CoaBC [Deltaproteobacteria bacterium]